jgi:hypothetical protein
VTPARQIDKFDEEGITQLVGAAERTDSCLLNDVLCGSPRTKAALSEDDERRAER